MVQTTYKRSAVGKHSPTLFNLAYSNSFIQVPFLFLTRGIGLINFLTFNFLSPKLLKHVITNPWRKCKPALKSTYILKYLKIYWAILPVNCKSDWKKIDHWFQCMQKLDLYSWEDGSSKQVSSMKAHSRNIMYDKCSSTSRAISLQLGNGARGDQKGEI